MPLNSRSDGGSLAANTITFLYINIEVRTAILLERNGIRRSINRPKADDRAELMRMRCNQSNFPCLQHGFLASATIAT